MDDPPDLTADDTRNGWTAEALADYHAQRDRETGEMLDYTKRLRPMPTVQNSRYSRLHWRR